MNISRAVGSAAPFQLNGTDVVDDNSDRLSL